jgi:hypothetical protein
MDEERWLKEVATDTDGNVLWSRVYDFKRLSAPEELIIEAGVHYRVVSSYVDHDTVKTILRRV